jgi:tRNA nucleotidyltransferase/poly(A) polymerase
MIIEKKILESLYLKIYENIDFKDKWQNALNSSEELRVAVDLMNNIKKLFPEYEIYIVGGVPRDLLMGNEIDDVDLATNIPLEKLGNNFNIRNISKNDSQPVYDIGWKEYHYDIAKFRTDSGDVGRQNNISIETDSFEKDTERRDITINSFGIDSEGKIVDYQNGVEDLKNQIIRAVGDPKKRFTEDATRILRIFRFAAKTGFSIDEETKNAAIELKHLLSDSSHISLESISKEFYKAAKSGKSLMKFLQNLQDTKILHDILPEFTSMEGFTHNPEHHPEGDSKVLGHIYECLAASQYTDPVINLAVLFHDFGKATTKGEKNGHSTYYKHESAGVPIVQNIFNRLKFNELSAQDKKNILIAVEKHMLIHNLDKLNIKTLVKLILDPSWEVVKAVGYCDEASRGMSLFNRENFWEKIKRAEDKVSKIGGNTDELRLKLKNYINGNLLIQWFPNLEKDKPQIGKLLKSGQEYVLDQLNNDIEPSQDNVKNFISSLMTESFKAFFYIPRKNLQ